jgi:hypothetical protein
LVQTWVVYNDTRLAAVWSSRLAVESVSVEVGSLSRAGESLNSVGGTRVVRGTCNIRDQSVGAISSARASRDGLASSWCSRLTLLCLNVHESIVADSSGSESVQTCEVSLADISVTDVHSIASAGTDRILTTLGYSVLALSLGFVEVCVDWAVLDHSCVSSAREVACAQVVACVRSISTSDTQWVLASSWNGILASLCCLVEVLVTTGSSRV